MKRILLSSVAAGVLIAGSIFALSPTAASADPTLVGTVEGESMTSVQGYGTVVQNDTSAVGGKRLMIDSNVTVTKTFTTSAASDYFMYRVRTDPGTPAARSKVYLDNVLIADQYSSQTAWGSHTYTVNVAAGSHTLKIQFLTAAVQNLYVDITRFFQSEPSTPSPTPTTPSPSPTTTTPPPSNQTTHQAFVTGYSYWDNTPPGSSAISHPQIHTVAAGTGTFSDPITLAVGHSIINNQDILDFPAGTKFYLPYLRRYVIVEDTCGDGPTPQNGPCHRLDTPGNPAPSGSEFWIDVWVGGGNQSQSASDTCMSNISDKHTVIKNPANNYVVASGEITANCTMYGETPVTV